MNRLAVRHLWRDWRGGDLGVLITALIIAVGTVATISMFVDRLRAALLAESATFLGADLVVRGGKPIPDSVRNTAQVAGLQVADTLEFPSMVFGSESAFLGAVKAVSDGYPLRGTVIAGTEAFGRGSVVDGIPEPGTVWLESRLLPAIGVVVGDTVEIGVAEFRVDRVILKEPDRGGGFYAFGPRVMMNFADVERTEVVQPGSRLAYRLLVAGDADVLATWRDAITVPDGWRIQDISGTSPFISDALERAESFLLLGGLLAVVLAGVATALAARRYSDKHMNHVAIMKTLGASPSDIQQLYLLKLLLLGLITITIGVAIGFVLQWGTVTLLDDFIPIELPPPGPRPVIIAALTGMICLFSFALPPLLRLQHISPLRVLRRDTQMTGGAEAAVYAAGIVGTFALMLWYSGSVPLTLWIAGGAAATCAVLVVLALILLRVGRAAGMQAQSVWRLALAGLQRRRWQSVSQIAVFTLAIMLLLIILLVRTALLDEWQGELPEDAPNHFLINIPPDEVDDLRDFFVAEDIAMQELYPMIRGRIIKVDGLYLSDWARTRRGEPIATEEEDDAPRGSSERNFTWAESLPPGNRLLSGEWWDGPGQWVSLERDIAQRIGVGPGATLTFSVADVEFEATVRNVREVNWDSMQPNFYYIFSPGVLEDYAATWMTSFHLEPERKRLLNDLLSAFPRLTLFEVDALIRQIRQIIDQVTLAIELVLGLILAAGSLVLVASIQASMDERHREHAILRTLGAGRPLVLGSLIIEFCALGVMAGLLASAAAEGTVFGLQTEIFELGFTPHPWLWFVGPLVGMLIIGGVGLLVTLKVVKTPPIQVLRG